MSNTTPEKGGGIGMGVLFLLIGLFSAALSIGFVYVKAGSDDFFYITSTVNGIRTTEYSPGFVIGMLIFCFLFSAAFIGLGIYMMRNRFGGGAWTSGVKVTIKQPYNKDEKAVGQAKERADDSVRVDTYGNVKLTFNGRRSWLRRWWGEQDENPIPRIFVCLGSLVIVIGIALLVYDRVSLQSLIQTEARVTNTYCISRTKMHGGITRTYYAKVEYMIGDQPYKSQITVSKFFSKSNVTIYCDPRNPIICRTNDEFLVWYIVLFSVGGLFTFGGVFIGHHIKMQNRRGGQ